MIPKRIQLSRRKGWRMPENTVKVDRSTKWGNPYANVGTRADAAAMFRELMEHPEREPQAQLRLTALGLRIHHIDELRGKNLACWCPLDQPCHADVLLEIANAETAGLGVPKE